MCGIFGILTPNPSKEELQRVNDLLAHRGPDDSGVYIGEGVGLAARRLSIIDLTTGHQPLSNETGNVWVTFNGEIANAPVLRSELESYGHSFATRADTETIVHAYEQWGDAAVTHLRGMFAFGLWDAKRRRLLLGRDRFGIKPLYYAQVGERFAFASEIRPIFEALPELPRVMNMEALWRLFEVGFVPAPLSPFQNIHKLPPARTLVVENSVISQQTYWQLKYPQAGEHRRIGLTRATHEFMEHLVEAVEAWRMSDVPVASLLSGGIDSSALAALLTDLNGSPIHTYNIGFSAESHDETHAAIEVADFIHSHHRRIDFNKDSFDNLPDVIRHIETPRCMLASVALYLLYQTCHEAGFKVILVGEGSDELLGGYSWYQSDRRLRLFAQLPASLRKGLAQALPPGITGGKRILKRDTLPDVVERYILHLRWGLPQHKLLNMQPPTPLVEVWRERFAADLQGLHPFDQMQLIEHQTRLTDEINHGVDRTSMAHSVESRPPFLDHLLWEFTAQLPPAYKLHWRENKYLLRRGMHGKLPASTLHRLKKGLDSPHEDWWRSRRMPEWVEEHMGPAALTKSGYFNLSEVERMRKMQQSDQGYFSRVLSGILTTQLLHEQMIEG